MGSSAHIRFPFRALVVTLGVPALLLSGPAAAGHHDGGGGSDTTERPWGKGDLSKGAFYTPLTRGAAVPYGLYLPPLPNDCNGHLDLTIAWDESKNEVKVKLEGDNALYPYPDVDRTEGVDYFENPFFPEPVDYEDGRYQLWIVGTAGPVMNFYYDPVTLDLIGGPTDFEEPPAAIPVPFPTLYMFSTPFFQADDNNDVSLEWEFAYDGATRGDRPEFSHHIVSFPPTNLCFANPYRLDLSTLTLYVSDPLPASQARPWSDYLRGGLLFDVTIETAEYYTEPPRTNGAATYSGGTAVGGAIPKGWQLDIEAAFAGLAPPIKRFPGAGSCEPHYEERHAPFINFCE